MARRLDEFFDVERAVAEGVHGLRAGGDELLAEVVFVVGGAHPFAAAAGGRLDHDWEAGLARGPQAVLHVRRGAVGARHDGHAGGAHGLLRDGLVAHLGDGLRARADKRQVVVVADARELGVLGQEAVARVDGVGAGDLGRGDDGRDVEVALRRRRRPDADGLVGEADGECVAVGRGVHRDGLDPHLAAGADDAERDLAAVGDEDFLDHRVLRVAYCVFLRFGASDTQYETRNRFLGTEHKQRLLELDGLPVLDQDLLDGAGGLGLDLVHQLHRLDDAQRLAHFHAVADGDEVVRVG